MFVRANRYEYKTQKTHLVVYTAHDKTKFPH